MSLGRAPLPKEIPAVSLDPEGRLTQRSPDEFRFSFAFLGAEFVGRIDGDWSAPSLCVTAELGPVPYTVESASRRRDVLTLIRAATVLTHARFRISSDRQIRAAGAIRVSTPVSHARLLAALVEILLELKPHLLALRDLLAPPDSPSAEAIG
jgi:hypothetical protein